MTWLRARLKRAEAEDHSMRHPRLRRWGRQQPHDVETSEAPDSSDQSGEGANGGDDGPRPSGWTAGSHFVARTTTTAILVMLVCGPAAIALDLIRGEPAPTVMAAEAPGQASSEEASAAEFAERFVATWLTTDDGNASRLADFIDIGEELVWPDHPVAAASTPSAARIVHQPNGVWTVTVGINVQDHDQDTTYRRYYAVSITYADGAMAALTLPTPVPGPEKADAPDTAYGVDITVDSAAGQTVSDFLNAALAGAGDLSRYTSPGADIHAVTPTAYASIEVLTLAADVDIAAAGYHPDEGDEAQVLVTATAETRGGGSLPAQYALTLRSRDDRWEVAAVEPAPQLEPTSTVPAS